MRRIIVHDEINTAYGDRTNELSKDIFQSNLEEVKRNRAALNIKKMFLFIDEKTLVHH